MPGGSAFGSHKDHAGCGVGPGQLKGKPQGPFPLWPPTWCRQTVQSHSWTLSSVPPRTMAVRQIVKTVLASRARGAWLLFPVIPLQTTALVSRPFAVWTKLDSEFIATWV